MSDPATSSTTLEQFRQEWQQEVQARSQHKSGSSGAGGRPESTELRKKLERPLNRPPGNHPLSDQPEEEIAETSTSGLTERIESLQIAGDADEDEFSKLGRDEPETALEHYERAVEKEGQGKLGDSLAHYRRAFKLDENVDKQYKDKYFAHKWKSLKPVPVTVPSEEDTSKAQPSVSHQSQPDPQAEVVLQTTAQLIASYADAEIIGTRAIIEGDKPPPCPIKDLPTEVMLELLRHVAIKDVSVYVRLGTVCKKLAYHVFSEPVTWKRIALGPEFGLASQQYHFNTDLKGRPSIWQALAGDDEDEKPMPSITAATFPEDQDWKDVFQSHPRIRFTGIYISTVNYTRAGGASVTPSTWGQQVHIVTYYRYLRFFRDGTLISLLTTHEPIDVVGHLTKENLVYARSTYGKDTIVPHVFAGHGHTVGDRQVPPPPTAQNILKHALRGRWRLCHPSLETTQVGLHMASPGDIHIETEAGAGPRYMYTMHLSLKTGNTRNKSATKNNKLVWKGFWSYNTITEDWAEFHLRNDKAFWFSRVKSYGLGY